MGLVYRLTGVTLVLGVLLGSLVVAWALLAGLTVPVATVGAPAAAAPRAEGLGSGWTVPVPAVRASAGAVAPEDDVAELAARPLPPAPITQVRVPRINLKAAVVPAKFVVKESVGTWEVPAFKAGHAEHTAGAGQPGNAVLFGHVASRNLGNVFQVLERAQLGDVIEVYAEERRFEYEVVELRRVPRTDVSVVEPTSMSAISLITCTGVWLPHLNDYSERLVVRGELVVHFLARGEDLRINHLAPSVDGAADREPSEVGLQDIVAVSGTVHQRLLGPLRRGGVRATAPGQVLPDEPVANPGLPDQLGKGELAVHVVV